MHDQQRGVDLVGKEDRRVLDVQLERVAHGGPDTRLCLLVLKLAAAAGLPTDTAVRAGHVRYRGTRACGLKHVGPGYQVSHLVAAPALSLYGHVLRVYPFVSSESLGARYHRVVGVLARLSHRVMDVRSENDIAPAHEEGDVDDGSARCRGKIAIKIVGMLLIRSEER